MRQISVILVLLMLSFAFLAAILAVMQVGHLRISQVLKASQEMVLPLAAGLLTATIISHDAAIELQLTMPTFCKTLSNFCKEAREKNEAKSSDEETLHKY